MKYFLTVLTLFGATTAQADSQFWNYKDWNVVVETVDTGEDIRVTCRAFTGGDGDPTLDITVSNGDALPPYYYPAPTLIEQAPRGYSTGRQQNQMVTFSSDDGWAVQGSIEVALSAEGFEIATSYAPVPEAQQMLQAMRRAGNIVITSNDVSIYIASLNGFTAAYGKIAEQCGFPTTGVID